MITIASDRKVLITGGASGLGLEIARSAHRDGAMVALVDIDGSRAHAEAARLGDRAIAAQADVRSQRNVRDAVAECAHRLGGLDSLVVSAGVIHFKPLQDVEERDWDLTLDVNLKGAFLACQAAVPYLAASGRGRIVTIASDAGRRGAPLIQAYAASKFGLVGLTESLAAELGPTGITVNCVCPAACPTTRMGEAVTDWKARTRNVHAGEIVESAARGNPLGRNAREADVAAAVLFFLSDEASFLTGVSLDVDGGLHLGALPGMS